MEERFQCTGCHEAKPASEYSYRKSGLRKKRCKACLALENRIYKRRKKAERQKEKPQPKIEFNDLLTRAWR